MAMQSVTIQSLSNTVQQRKNVGTSRARPPMRTGASKERTSKACPYIRYRGVRRNGGRLRAVPTACHFERSEKSVPPTSRHSGRSRAGGGGQWPPLRAGAGGRRGASGTPPPTAGRRRVCHCETSPQTGRGNPSLRPFPMFSNGNLKTPQFSILNSQFSIFNSPAGVERRAQTGEARGVP